MVFFKLISSSKNPPSSYKLLKYLINGPIEFKLGIITISLCLILTSISLISLNRGSSFFLSKESASNFSRSEEPATTLEVPSRFLPIFENNIYRKPLVIAKRIKGKLKVIKIPVNPTTTAKGTNVPRLIGCANIFIKALLL